MTAQPKSVSDIHYRDAVAADATALTELAVRSKQSWGYDDAFMAAAQSDLEVTEDLIAQHCVRIATREGRAIGFVTLVIDGAAGEILQLFVDPAQHGQGIGQALIQQAFAVAEQEGVSCVTVESDPNAQPFYEAAGMTVTGSAASIVDPARALPVLSWSPPDRGGGAP